MQKARSVGLDELKCVDLLRTITSILELINCSVNLMVKLKQKSSKKYIVRNLFILKLSRGFT